MKIKTDKPQVQIDKELFLDLCRYHIADLKDAEREQRIITALEAKINKLASRERYIQDHFTNKSS